MASDDNEPTPTLSVVVPVFNQAASIVENLEVIRRRVGEALQGDTFEIVVVSDGSIDATEDTLLARQGIGGFRVFHYDRNLGKGYAVKLGALEAAGDWIGFVDADLDLDPADLAVYVRHARERRLDFAIGSKRHPDSQVEYPPVRVAASWCFQQLVRVLFRLDVRDTQVGLKLFSREVAEQVLPMLLVKRFAFDIELLAVGRAFGFSRIEELPVRLDYRFTGSGVRSRAVLRALIDTAAIFYRLRILRYYQRRRTIAGPYAWTRPRRYSPMVSVLAARGSLVRERDYANVEVIEVDDASPQAFRSAAEQAKGEVVALLEPGGQPSANWLSATVPFLARDEIAAVVTPKLAPLAGGVRARAAAAVDESRLGAGLGYFRYTPGNMRYVEDFPGGTLVLRRESFLALPAGTASADLVSVLARSGRVLYTPEAVIVAQPAPLFGPHLRVVFANGRRRGIALRHRRLTGPGRTPVTQVLLLVAAGALGAYLGGGWTDVGLAFAIVYFLGLAGAIAATGLRSQSVRVALLAGVGITCTHLTYAAGLGSGLVV